MSDPYKYFRIEARELHEQLVEGMLHVQKGVAPSDTLARLLRVAHTLKGAARVVRLKDIAEAAHALEDVLGELRGAEAGPRDGRVSKGFGIVDRIGDAIAKLNLPAPRQDAAPPEDDPFRAMRADVTDVDRLLSSVALAQSELPALRRVIPREVEASATIALDRIERELTQAREAAERLRLVPASALFASLERSARETATTLHKRVGFHARGGELRVEAQVLSVVHPALLQAVRNAVAHGVEAEPLRAAARKPTEGAVTLEVVRQGTRIAFRCTDDGAGIDLHAVEIALRDAGILSTSAPSGPDDVLELLKRGGVSTSKTVTEVAGRGVGLDVFRESAERLRGEVRITTHRGTGTTIELLVPFTLAAVEVLIVESTGGEVAIPLDAVSHTARYTSTDIARTREGAAVFRDGDLVPFVDLDELLPGAARPHRPDRPWSIVFVHGGGERQEPASIALGVERLRGVATVSVRPLPDLAPESPLIAGIYLDPEGSPRVVLDPDGLLREGPSRRSSPEPVSRPNAVLVVDDSLTTRMLEKSILESAGYEVDVAVSGEEALEKVLTESYSLFLVDVEMPGIDGFTLVERLRSLPATRATPAILVTSRSSPEDKARGQRVGAQGYVVKSEFDQRDLLERIRGLVQ